MCRPRGDPTCTLVAHCPVGKAKPPRVSPRGLGSRIPEGTKGIVRAHTPWGPRHLYPGGRNRQGSPRGAEPATSDPRAYPHRAYNTRGNPASRRDAHTGKEFPERTQGPQLWKNPPLRYHSICAAHATPLQASPRLRRHPLGGGQARGSEERRSSPQGKSHALALFEY